MKEKIEPHFYLRTDKVNKNGKLPLYIRFPRIDGEEPKFSMGKVHFSPDEWDPQSRLPKDNYWRTELEKELLRINRAICRCYEDNITITKAKLKEIVTCRKESENISIKTPHPEAAQFSDYYIECIEKKLKNGQIRESTYKSHITTINALNEFYPNLRIKDINADTLNRFVDFLKKRSKSKGRSGEGTIINRLSQIKCAISYIDALGIPIKNPFRTNDIYIMKPRRSVIYLNDEEFYKMSRLLLQIRRKRLNDREYTVLMMFLLACSTGMRFSDVHSLRWHNINIDYRNVVIDFRCAKSGKMNYIPLNPMAEDIVCRAASEWGEGLDLNKPLFIKSYSNTTVNKTLKILAKKAGIFKNITFHSSRHTFATYLRNNNLITDLRKIVMGHSGDITESYEHWNAYEASKSKDMFACLDFEILRTNYINAINSTVY